jgi:hypothetical protein
MAKQSAENTSARDKMREVQNNLVKSLKSTIVGADLDQVEPIDSKLVLG